MGTNFFDAVFFSFWLNLLINFCLSEIGVCGNWGTANIKKMEKLNISIVVENPNKNTAGVKKTDKSKTPNTGTTDVKKVDKVDNSYIINNKKTDWVDNPSIADAKKLDKADNLSIANTKK